MQRHDKAKKYINFSIWKLAVAGALLCLTFFCGVIYVADINNMVCGGITVFSFGGAIFMAYWSFKKVSFGYKFERKYTGKENTIMVLARRDKQTGLAIPVELRIMEYHNIPPGTRPHYVRNWDKHMYELYNDLDAKKIMPVVIKDNKPYPPSNAKEFYVMQEFQDYMEYNPATTLQKISPFILLAAIVIVGLLMVMTVGKTPTALSLALIMAGI